MFRVTDKLLFDSLSFSILTRNAELLKTQNMLASGKRINRPSDDPVAASAILGYKKIISGLDQYQRNLEFAQDTLSSTEVVLGSVVDVLAGIRDVAVAQGTGTANAETRLSTSYVVAAFFDQLISAGNTNVGGRYIFSGYLTDTQAFDAAGTYGGDSNERKLRIAPDTDFTYGFIGERAFKGVGVSGGVDIFTLVDDLKTALETDDMAGIQNAIGLIDSAEIQISGVRSDVGGRINRTQAELLNNQNLTLQMKITLSGLEDADVIELSTELIKHRTALEALYSAAGNVMRLSIFNYIR